MPKSREAFEREQRRVKEAVGRGVAVSADAMRANAMGAIAEPQRLQDHVVDELNDHVRILSARE